MIHIELEVKNATGKPWREEYALKDGTDPQKWGEAIINRFNETRLRKYDRERTLVAVHMVSKPADFNSDDEVFGHE